MKRLLVLMLIPAFMMACKSTRHNIESVEVSEPLPTVTDFEKQKLSEGIDFYAKGNSPASWSLEMEWGNIIRFRSIDGTEANSTAVQGINIAGGNFTRYSTSSTYGDLVIDVLDEACIGNSETGNKKVTVSINNKRYEGCGAYLFNPALNGKWVIVKIDNQNLAEKDYAKGRPQVNIDLASQKASGHDGCNSFSSAIVIQGNKIKFSAILSTKMACPGNKTAIEILQKLEGHFSGYSFSDDQQLILYLYDDSTLYLSKI